MKFAICNETFQDWPHAEAFACAAECGYQGLEIAPFTLADDARSFTPAQRAEIRRLADAEGLEIIGLHWLLAKTTGLHVTSAEVAVRNRTATYLADLARLCADLGGHLLIFGSPMQRNLTEGITADQGMDYAVEVIEKILPDLEDAGITFAIEPLTQVETNFLTSADQAAELVSRIGSPNVRLHLDCKAMVAEAEPIPALIARHAGILAHLHANDPNRLGPGFGQLDFVPIFEALGRIDYRGWVSVEVFDITPGAESIAQKSMEYMLRCLNEVRSQELGDRS